MIAVCYEKSDKKVVIRQGRETFHQLVDGSERVELAPEILIEFSPVPQKETEDVFADPSFMPGGPTPRRGVARVVGTLGIEQEAEKAGMTPDELVFWMLHYPQYDTAKGFIIRRDDGRKVLSLEDWVIDLKEDPDGKRRFCRACGEDFDVRGVQGHTMGKDHKDAFEKYKARLREKITLLGRERKAEDSVAYL